MPVLTCANCSTNIVPTATGVCPSCRREFTPAAFGSAHKPVATTGILEKDNSRVWINAYRFGILIAICVIAFAVEWFESRQRQSELEVSQAAAAELKRRFQVEGIETRAVCLKHLVDRDSHEQFGHMRRTGWVSGSWTMERSESLRLLFFDGAGKKHEIDYFLSSARGQGNTYKKALDDLELKGNQ